jgi:hypothetical protein
MKSAFAAHKLQSHQLRALGRSVIVADMAFDERITRSGIVLLNDNGTTKGIRPRWAKVYAVGPEQHDVKVGEWILVAHGRWTRGLDIEDETGMKTLRRVDPDDILVQSDQPVSDETFSDAVHVDRKPDHMLHT